MPALLNRRSRRPNFAFVCANRLFTDSGLPTSVTTPSALSAPHSATTFSSRSPRRAAKATFQPALTSATPAALPMPAEAPVTIATLF